MSSAPQILVLGGTNEQISAWSQSLAGNCEFIPAADREIALRLLNSHPIAGICTLDADLSPSERSLNIYAPEVLLQFHDALALLDLDLKIIWRNKLFEELTSPGTESLKGQAFYEAFGQAEILGPELSPLMNAVGTRQTQLTRMRCQNGCCLELRATCVRLTESDQPSLILVSVRDVTVQERQQEKLHEVYQAGLELGDLQPEEVSQMTVEDRVNLLKSKIVHFTQDLLKYENLEIRLLDPTNEKLNSLLVLGMRPEAASRELLARETGNGVTGYVAATGKSYLCEDTENDPLYLPGAEGARSSLTVPLILHDKIQGTFNVESTRPRAFDESDREFLFLFGHQVAIALNTLDLLVAEKVSTTNENVVQILKEVSRPLDEVLNEASWIVEQVVEESEISNKLQLILRHTRDIKELIQNVGEELQPEMTRPHALPTTTARPRLRRKKVLIVDGDEQTRRSALELLAPCGVLIESARNGAEAARLARQFKYDAVLTDIRLPDMNGYECFRALREIDETLPIILMTSFGYDAAHSIVKARQAGLKSEVIYKPFKPNRLLEELEKVVSQPRQRVPASPATTS